MKRLLLLFVAFTCTLFASAYDAYIDGIYYDLNNENKTAEVTNETGDNKVQSYSGDIIIPNSIKYYDIEYSVTSIGGSSFSGCSGLTSVTIPNSVTSIIACAFEHCSGLTSVTIPNSVTSIGVGAFAYCSKLTNVTIPESMKSIGEKAFLNCIKLKTIYCEAENPPSVEGNTFNNVPKNSGTLYVPKKARNAYSMSSGWSAWKNIYCYDEIEHGTCGNHLKWFLDKDGTLNILGQGDMFGYSAVENGTTRMTDAPWGNYNNEIKKVVIMDGVTSVGSNAFYGCNKITSIDIPNTITSIGGWAFNNCTSLNKPIYNSTIFARLPENQTGRYSVPDGITTIVSNAFENCKGLTSVNIPETVTSIGDWAFCGCFNLSSATISNSVKTIGQGAFIWCSSLTSVTIPSSVTTIKDYTFSGCI